MNESMPDPVIGARWLDWYRAGRNGTPQAANQWVIESRPFVKAIVQRSIGRRMFAAGDSSDVTQDFYLKLETLLPSKEFRGTTGPEFISWLRKIVRHQLLDTIRRAKTRRRGGGRVVGQLPEDSGGGIAIPDDGSTPFRHAVKQQEREKFAAALEKLPPAEREVIRLRTAADNSTWADVGRQMNRTADAVKQLFRRPSSRLREICGS